HRGGGRLAQGRGPSRERGRARARDQGGRDRTLVPAGIHGRGRVAIPGERRQGRVLVGGDAPHGDRREKRERASVVQGAVDPIARGVRGGDGIPRDLDPVRAGVLDPEIHG